MPNESKLDGVTTMSANYKPHLNVKPPPRRQQEKWKGTSAAFCGETTTKSDYVQVPLPPHFVHFVPPYVKSEHKLEGQTTQALDYKNWGVTQVPKKFTAVKAAVSAPEDR